VRKSMAVIPAITVRRAVTRAMLSARRLKVREVESRRYSALNSRIALCFRFRDPPPTLRFTFQIRPPARLLWKDQVCECWSTSKEKRGMEVPLPGRFFDLHRKQ